MEMTKLQTQAERDQELLHKNIIVASMDMVLKWARSNSLWPLSSGLACCAIEMMSAAAARMAAHSITQLPEQRFRGGADVNDIWIVSADGKTLWVTNSDRVIAFDVQPDGSTKNRRDFGLLDGDRGGDAGGAAAWRGHACATGCGRRWG